MCIGYHTVERRVRILKRKTWEKTRTTHTNSNGVSSVLCFVYDYFTEPFLSTIVDLWILLTVPYACFRLRAFTHLLSIITTIISNCVRIYFSSFNKLYSGQRDRLFLNFFLFKLKPFANWLRFFLQTCD